MSAKIKFSKFIAILSTCLFWVPSSFSQSLEKLGVIETIDESVIEFVGHEKYNLAQVNSFRFYDPVSSLSILKFEKARDEIDLTSQQFEKCSELTNKSIAIRRDAKDRIISISDEKKREEFSNWYSTQFALVENESKKILLDHQLKKVKRLNNQLLLKKKGIVTGIRELLENQGLELSKDDERRLVECCKDQQVKLSERCEALVKKFDHEYFESFLSKTENRPLQFFWQGKNPTFMLDWIRAQANVKSDVLQTIDDDIASIFRQPSLFRIAEDGAIQLENYSGFIRAGNYERTSVVEHILKQIANRELLAESKLSDLQFEQIDSILQNIQRSRLFMDDHLVRSENIWLDYENVIDMQNHLVMTIDNSLKELLSKSQFEDLLFEVSLGYASRLGVNAVIRNDRLKKRLKLNNDQLKEFETLLSKAANEAAVASQETFVAVCKEVVGSIKDNACSDVIDNELGLLVDFGECSFLIMNNDLTRVGK